MPKMIYVFPPSLLSGLPPSPSLSLNFGASSRESPWQVGCFGLICNYDGVVIQYFLHQIVFQEINILELLVLHISVQKAARNFGWLDAYLSFFMLLVGLLGGTWVLAGQIRLLMSWRPLMKVYNLFILCILWVLVAPYSLAKGNILSSKIVWKCSTLTGFMRLYIVVLFCLVLLVLYYSILLILLVVCASCAWCFPMSPVLHHMFLFSSKISVTFFFFFIKSRSCTTQSIIMFQTIFWVFFFPFCFNWNLSSLMPGNLHRGPESASYNI